MLHIVLMLLLIFVSACSALPEKQKKAANSQWLSAASPSSTRLWLWALTRKASEVTRRTTTSADHA